MTTRVLIADDEAPARRLVRSYLANRADVVIIAEAENGLEVVDAVRTLDPQLVILDIQMPGMTGFEAIEAIGVDAMPAVIFATAYDEFALQAFDVHAVDFLLKPFSRERFDRAFDRAMQRMESGTTESDKVSRLIASLPRSSTYLHRVVVREGERIFFVATADVVHLTAEGNYVRVHTADASHLIRGTLSDLETRLDPKQFARIHRSAIVNIEAIKEVRPHFHGDYIVVLKRGETLRLSRRYQQRLLSEPV
jgi:two-component system LytT family response regulator